MIIAVILGMCICNSSLATEIVLEPGAKLEINAGQSAKIFCSGQALTEYATCKITKGGETKADLGVCYDSRFCAESLMFGAVVDSTTFDSALEAAKWCKRQIRQLNSQLF